MPLPVDDTPNPSGGLATCRNAPRVQDLLLGSLYVIMSN